MLFPIYGSRICQHVCTAEDASFTFDVEFHIVIVQAFDVAVFIGNGGYNRYEVRAVGFQFCVFIIYPKK